MANQPRSASDYLAQAASQTGAVKASKSSKSKQWKALDTESVGPQSTQAKGGTGGVLGTLMDLITRPLSGVTNVIQSVVNRSTDAQDAIKKGDTGRALGDLGNEIGGSLGGDFLSGMFSSNPEQHRSTSDVIEQSTDTIGKMLDPKYKNVVDNANPVLKGVLGFAGDIALDPLTWIPGGQLVKGAGLALKGGKLAVEGAKGALDAVSGATKTAKVVDDAAATAAADASKISQPTVQSVLQNAGAKIDRAAGDGLSASDPEFKAIYDSHLKDLEQHDTLNQVMDLSNARMQGVVAKDVARAAQSVKGQDLRSALDALGPMEIKNVKRVPGVTAKTARPAEFMPEASVDAEKGFVHQLANTPIEKLDVFGAKAPAVQNAAKLALQGNAKALKATRALYDSKYLPEFAAAKQQGKIMGVHFREVPPTAPVESSTVTALDSIGNFKRQLAMDRGTVESRLGKPLTDALGRYDNVGNFDSAVSRIKGVLDQHIDVTTLRHLSSSDDAALRQIGLDPATIPTGLTMQSTKNAESVAPTLAEQLSKIVDPDEMPTEYALAQHALDNTIMKDLDAENLAKTHKFETKTGTLRTADQFGAGWGRNMREANTYFQYNLAKALSEMTSKAVSGLFGRARAIAVSNLFRRSLRLAERALDQQGVPLTIGVGPKRIPLSTSQILDTLDRIDAKTTHWAFYNHDTAVPWTNLSDAVYSMLTGGGREDVERMLRQVQTRHIAADGRPKPLPNNMIQGKGRFGRQVLDSNEMVSKLTDLLTVARPVLNHVVAANAQALGARGIEETYEITNDVLNSLEALKQAPGGTGALLQAVGSMDSRVAEVAKDLGVLKSSKDTAQAVVESVVPSTDQIIAKGTVRASDMLANSEAAEEAQQKAVAISQKTFEDAVASDPAITSGPAEDFGQEISQIEGRGIVAKVLPIVSRRAGTEKVYDEWMQTDNVQRMLVGMYSLRLSKLAKMGLGREDLANRLVNARNGVTTNDPVTSELHDLWGQMFGAGPDGGTLINNAFFRNANNVHHINSVMEMKGLPERYSFDIDRAQREVATAKKAGQKLSLARALSNQAGEWEITDPLSTLSSLYHAFTTVQIHQTLIQDFLKMAKETGAYSEVPRAGFKQVSNETGRSVLSMYFPKNAYVEENVLRQAHVVDNLMQQSMQLSGPLGSFIKEVYVPLQQAWKFGMTLPNPTHQIRNYIGDDTLQYLSMGTKGFVKSKKVAAQALATHNNYDGYDAVKYLQGLEELPDAGAKVFTNKRGWNLTADGLYTAMANRGNLPSFRYLEQLNQDKGEQGAGALARIWESIEGSKITQKIGGVSEARDHLSRLQHAAQFLAQNADNPQYKTLDDLLSAASRETRKWHPDGTDMTQAERYFRLVIPFYSWQRKAIPLIVESLLAHPGRISSIPKAQYNIAVAAGIDPDSLSDPFPQDQLFPSYMTNQIGGGPIAKIDGKYYGISPGFASNDVLNSWFTSNPLNNILGQTSPLIRAPWELATGKNVATQGDIHDTSDYIDSQLPGAAQVSRLTGTSVTGSLLGILNGTGLDPQYQVAKGNRTPTDIGLSALNWLTGAGIQDMSAPNAINYAEIEKRNQAGATSGR